MKTLTRSPSQTLEVASTGRLTPGHGKRPPRFQGTIMHLTDDRCLLLKRIPVHWFELTSLHENFKKIGRSFELDMLDLLDQFADRLPFLS